MSAQRLYTLYRLEELESLVLNKPSDTTAASTGPAVGGASLDTPLPTAFAGALAAIAYQQGGCSPSSCGDSGFDNLRGCLEKLLGQGFHLYTGFAIDGNGCLWLPVPGGFIEAREAPRLLESPRGAAPRKRIRRRQRIGVALDYSSKTVRPGLLYTLEEVSMPPELSLALLVASARQPPASLPAKMGAKNRVALLRGSTGPSPRELLVYGGSGCDRWLLYLASPALLDESPWSSVVDLTSRDAENMLARLLLPTGLGPGSVERIVVPKTSPGLEVVAPGWCTPEARPRRPYLYVPPGTMLVVKASHGSIVDAVEKGLGLHAEIGWGTVAAICLSD